MVKKLIITGANGFVGSALSKKLEKSSVPHMAVVRKKNKNNQCVIGNYSDGAAWAEVLQYSKAVVHCAGRAHVIKEEIADPLAEFRKINVGGTLNLARQALVAGVRRFIFISSIGVNGSHTTAFPFTEAAHPLPHADYATSKYEAEQGLCELVQNTDMELVIIRPPLVYAGHASGNFARLLNLVNSKLPLPFASVRNYRSMIALENLVDFIMVCVDHPAAANQTFLVSDGVEMSTPQMVLYLAEGMGHKANFLPVPVSLMRLGAVAVGKRSMFEQLCESLVIDSSKARDLLGWQPVVTPAEALVKAGRDFKASLKKDGKK